MEKYPKYNDLPNDILIPKYQLEPEICVVMSEGLPKAFIKMVVFDKPEGKLKEISRHSEGRYHYSICDPGSKMAENAPSYLKQWGKILNDLIKKNIYLFQDEEYWETEKDRDVVRQIQEGVSFEDIT